MAEKETQESKATATMRIAELERQVHELQRLLALASPKPEIEVRGSVQRSELDPSTRDNKRGVGASIPASLARGSSQ